MSKRIYVGNLSYQAEAEDLTRHFEKVGQVLSARVVKDPASGRSRGFGFVEMNDEEADRAIEELNGSTLLNRAIVVSAAKEREAGAGGPRRTGGRGPARTGGRGGFGERGRGERPSWGR
jgi:cold-inducible RNA-binding protein